MTLIFSCLKNWGYEDSFDVGEEYIGQSLNRDFVIVEDKFGKEIECFKNRFKVIGKNHESDNNHELWKTKKGRTLHITEMSESHLKSAISFLKRKHNISDRNACEFPIIFLKMEHELQRRLEKNKEFLNK